MKLYYFELTSTGATIHVVEDYDRHKLWVSNPNATEISKNQYNNILKTLTINNNEQSIESNTSI